MTHIHPHRLQKQAQPPVTSVAGGFVVPPDRLGAMATDPIPTTSFGRVIARYILVIGDTSADPDALPDVVPASGEVVFTPKSTQLLYETTPGVIAYPKAVTGKLSANGELVDAAGNLGIWLLKGAYTAKVNIVGVTTTPVDIVVTEAHATTPLDLTRYTPAPVDPTVKFVVNQQVYDETIAARDAAIAARDAAIVAATNTGGGTVGWVSVLTGNEARPNVPHVIWAGGTSAPANMADGDMWLSETAVVTPPDEEPALAPPVISTSSLNALTQGQAFSQQLAATNSPTSWAVASGSIAGLSLSGTGLLSGTPTGSGAYSLTVGATNADGTGSKTFTGTITAAAVEPSTDLPDGAITLFSTPPGTPALSTDGSPSITVAQGFYATGTAKQVVGARIYKPAGVTVGGTWSAQLFDSAAGNPDLAAPVRSVDFPALVDGWNYVEFPTPYTAEVGEQNTLWIGYFNSVGQYLSAPQVLPSGATPSTPAGISLVQTSFLSPNTTERTVYRIGSGGTNGVFQAEFALVWYAIDPVVIS